MTRETKIGLLVGLAFIIVIGILLSDHLTSSTDPPPAKLAVAGDTIRSGVTTPGVTGNTPAAPAVTPSVVTPHQTVPTPTDLAPRPQPVQPVQPVQVAVGGPTNPQPTPQVQHTSAPEAPAHTNIPEMRSDTSVPQAQDSEPVITRAAPVAATPEPAPQPIPASGNDVAAALREAARQHGEELVSLGGGNSAGSGVTPTPTRLTPGSTKQYVAVDGDSVSRLATKFLGANTKANREAIINANPSLKQNANMILVGKTYNIPANASPSGVVTQVATSSPPQVIQAPTQSATSENWYTVKDGDSLWKIATEQCGSAGAIAAIKELNKETLKSDTVVINTKLRLPTKVAAN